VSNYFLSLKLIIISYEEETLIFYFYYLITWTNLALSYKIL